MTTWGTKQRSNIDTTKGGSRGVASHPPLEQPTEKILCMEKQMEICGSQKPCEAIKPQMQQPSMKVWFCEKFVVLQHPRRMKASSLLADQVHFKSLQCYKYLQFFLPKLPCFGTNVGQLLNSLVADWYQPTPIKKSWICTWPPYTVTGTRADLIEDCGKILVLANDREFTKVTISSKGLQYNNFIPFIELV